MLNGTLQLHDIRDVEAYCRTLLQNARLEITQHDAEDALAYLVETAWELSTKEPRQWHTSFSGWLTPLLRLRIIDWQRQRYGRITWTFRDYERDTGRRPQNLTRPRPSIHSLDDQLADPHATSTMGNPEHRDPDLVRLLTRRASPNAGPYKNLGRKPTHRAA
jgi:DNA-directed RNA polymerase specialized sigma24 family protein